MPTIEYTCLECGGIIDNATWLCRDCNYNYGEDGVHMSTTEDVRGVNLYKRALEKLNQHQIIWAAYSKTHREDITQRVGYWLDDKSSMPEPFVIISTKRGSQPAKIQVGALEEYKQGNTDPNVTAVVTLVETLIRNRQIC